LLERCDLPDVEGAARRGEYQVFGEEPPPGRADEDEELFMEMT
jgi:hypothetical protein